MNNTGRKSWARVGMNREPGSVNESGLSGPVTRYTLPSDEIERIFQDVKPEPHPEPIKSRARCHSKELKAWTMDEAEEVSLDEEIDVEEIERIESDATDPAWGFDGCKW